MHLILIRVGNAFHAQAESSTRDEKTDLRTRKVNGKVVAKIKFTKFA
jgi:hypothetical protein